MADNTIALGIRPPALPDYNALTVQRANMMQGFAEQDAMRQQTANAMLRQQSQDARQAQQDQMAMQDRTLRLSDEATTRTKAATDAENSLLGNSVNAMRYMPLAQRLDFYKAHVAPTLLKRGVTQEQIDSITPESVLSGEHLSDQELNSISAQFGGATVVPKTTALGNRMVQENPITGVVKEVLAAPPAAPPSGYAQKPDGTYRAIVGGPADPRVIAGNRAPPRASGGGAGLPPGFVLD